MKKLSWKVLLVFCLSVFAGSVVFIRQRAFSFVMNNEVAELSAAGLSVLDPALGKTFEQANLFGRASLRREGSFPKKNVDLDLESGDPAATAKAELTAELSSGSLEINGERQMSEGAVVADKKVGVEIKKVSGPRLSISEIFDAIDHGTPETLALISTQDLIRYPDYYPSILPRLKERALKNLVGRLEPEDWEGWDRITATEIKGVVDGNELSSSARTYLATIYGIHRELGSFLDETCLVFHNLYLAVQGGLVYDLEQELTALATRAGSEDNSASEELDQEQIRQRLGQSPSGQSPSGNNYAADRLPKSVPFVRLYKDPVFLKAFERINSILVADHFDSASVGTPLQRVLLIGTVRPELASKNILQALAEDLRELSFSPSPEPRLELFLNEYRKGFLARYAIASPRVRTVLANLYTIGAVDALHDGNRPLAEVLYGLSLRTQSGLAAQNQLAIVLYGKNFNLVRPKNFQESLE